MRHDKQNINFVNKEVVNYSAIANKAKSLSDGIRSVDFDRINDSITFNSSLVHNRPVIQVKPSNNSINNVSEMNFNDNSTLTGITSDSTNTDPTKAISTAIMIDVNNRIEKLETKTQNQTATENETTFTGNVQADKFNGYYLKTVDNYHKLPEIVVINERSVVEIGRNLDFHDSTSTSVDYNGRISYKKNYFHCSDKFVVENGKDIQAANIISNKGNLNNIIDRTVALETKNTEQDTRLDAIETKNTEQDTQLTNIETKNTEQDTQLTNIENKNTEQDTRLEVLENKTQNQSATENTTTFTGNVQADSFNGYKLGMNDRFYNIPAIPVINNDLVMEVGRYIDFHYNASTNTDYKSRLSITSPGNLHFDHSFILDKGSDFRARNLISDNGDLNNIIDRTVALENKNTEQDTQLTNIETKNTEQDTRLTNIETKNTEQDERLNNIIKPVEKDINDKTLSLSINVEREGDVFEYPVADEYKFQLNPISDDIYLKVNSVLNLYTTLYWAVCDESGVPHGQANEEINISYDGTNVSISANVLNSAIEIPQPTFDIDTKTLTVPRPANNYILLSYSNDDTTLKNFYCYHTTELIAANIISDKGDLNNIVDRTVDLETDLENCAKITTEEQYNQKTLNIGDAFIRVTNYGTDYNIDIGASTKTIFTSDTRNFINNYIYDNLDVNGNLNIKDELTINHVNIFDIIYPIGSIHMSLNPYPPLFGTWELISDGYFLMSTTTVPGEFGGSDSHTHQTADHTLTVEEMPAHTHPLKGYGQNLASGSYGYRFGAGGSKITDDTMLSTGNNKPHNHGDTYPAKHLPPYITCFMYKRTA